MTSQKKYKIYLCDLVHNKNEINKARRKHYGRADRLEKKHSTYNYDTSFLKWHDQSAKMKHHQELYFYEFMKYWHVISYIGS